MKFIHLSDLHLGKRVNEFSMLEEQSAILEQILGIIDMESPDGILIAGDIYDKSVPPAEAVMLFDDFLAKLSERNLQVFIISGNHDSPERIAFGSRIMDARGIHLSPVYNGEIQPFSMTDAYGAVNVYMLPFIKPAHVRRYFENKEIVTYTDAVKTAIEAMHVDPSERNILITHQFVTGASRRDSEEKSVGGTDNVDADVFNIFDYVALGHIHSAQKCSSEKIRYCGTPLKYSFSEMNDLKSLTVAEIGEPGTLPLIRTVPLTPLYDMGEIRGLFSELTDPSYYTDHPKKNHYLHIVLTDETDIPEAVSRLRLIYPNLMNLDYDNTRTRMNAEISDLEKAENLSIFELFSLFYEEQNGAGMSEEQSAYMQKLIETIEEKII
ncbi:MAG: exonuclease SbcCD subunit D [Clostridia bacterium]|nr:exonuclease SbcCD subunit D [Clostridia bacterium]